MIAARFAAPASDVAVLRYAAVAPDGAAVPEGSDDVPAERFFLQMRDLAGDGWTCISPWRVRARDLFGIPLPRRAFMVTIDSFDPSLSESVEPVLEEFGFRAYAALPQDAPPSTVAAAREMSKRGRVVAPDLRRKGSFRRLFGDCSGAPARIGGRRNREPAWPLPRIAVAGGRLAFSVEVRQDSVDPASFGTLRFSQVEGVPTPCALLVYGPGGMAPAAQADVPAPARRGESFRLPLPSGIGFPLDVVVYDTSRTVWQFGSTVPRSAVVRKPGYREPALAPDTRILGDAAASSQPPGG